MAYPMSTPLPGGGQFLQTPVGTQQQQQVRQNFLEQGLQNFNPEAVENRARQQFQTNTIPGLAERFTAQGGGQRSSAFQGALGQSAADLESQLAANRQGVGLQQLGIGLQSPFESHLQQQYDPYSGFLGGLGANSGKLLELGGKGLSYALGGKGGASQPQQPSTSGAQDSNLAGQIAGGVAGAALPAAAASGAGSGFLSSLSAGAAAAAPFAIPALGAAAVVGLPLLLYYLLGD